jgi:molybdenum cofactor synthesis domain-containing protein
MPDAPVTAALIVIGNEILSGRTKDANVTYLARQLTALGIVLAEVRMVRDAEAAIIEAVNALRPAHDYVFTTGGIGPTHDDITCEAVSKAFGLAYRINPEAQRILEDYYDGSGRELNAARLRMAYTPEGATLIDNPVSRAPGFQVENVYVLAGIPAVMRAMFESAARSLKGGAKVKSREIAVLLGEGDVARKLGALQERYEALEIGSYPFVRDGQFGTTLVLRGTDEAAIASAGDELCDILRALGGEPEETPSPAA